MISFNKQEKILIINKIVINLKNIVKNYDYENDNDITIEKLINNIKKSNKYLKYFSIYKNYYIIYNNKIISKTTNIDELFNCKNKTNSITNKPINNIISLEIIERQCGGGSLIIDMFMSIIKIGELFMMIGDAVIWFFKFILWVIKFLLWFMIDFLNPVTFFGDFFKSVILIIITICRVPFDLLQVLFSLGVNTIGIWFQSIWGWDMTTLTKADRESNYFQKTNLKKGKKCYLTNTNTVPFSIILGTILCPPMGVFMDMGTSGWLNIIICALLTLCFYLPGLCYALLIIYS